MLFWLLPFSIFSQDHSLRFKIQAYLRDKKAEVGVAIYHLDHQDTLTIGNHKHYPMQSVYKFHVALAVLDQVDQYHLSLDQKIWVKKSQLLPNTWSPLRDKYPAGNIALPISEILQYTVANSDNNGCDILFKLLGGPDKVHRYIQALGFKEVSIKTTEAQMHKQYNAQFANWTTPFAAVQLLQLFSQNNILSNKTQDFLWTTMVNTTTGPNKIKGLLPKNAMVAHKTGASGMNKQGITAAANDIGIMLFPNGSKVAIAVFVSNSKETEVVNDKIIAEISRLVWDYYQ